MARLDCQAEAVRALPLLHKSDEGPDRCKARHSGRPGRRLEPFAAGRSEKYATADFLSGVVPCECGIAQAHIDPPCRDVELACFGVVGGARLWTVWDTLLD
jgi:hypothetical protein